MFVRSPLLALPTVALHDHTMHMSVCQNAYCYNKSCNVITLITDSEAVKTEGCGVSGLCIRNLAMHSSLPFVLQ